MNEAQKELPLSALKLSFQPHVAIAPVFFDIHDVAVCIMTGRFRSLVDVERFFEESDHKGQEVYFYKLYEQATGYTLRYLVQAQRGPDGKFLPAKAGI